MFVANEAGVEERNWEVNGLTSFSCPHISKRKSMIQRSHPAAPPSLTSLYTLITMQTRVTIIPQLVAEACGWVPSSKLLRGVALLWLLRGVAVAALLLRGVLLLGRVAWILWLLGRVALLGWVTAVLLLGRGVLLLSRVAAWLLLRGVVEGGCLVCVAASGGGVHRH